MTRLHLAAALLSLCSFSAIPAARAADGGAPPPWSERQAMQDRRSAQADDDAGERAKHQLDAQTERLELEARHVMQSICRGC